VRAANTAQGPSQALADRLGARGAAGVHVPIANNSPRAIREMALVDYELDPPEWPYARLLARPRTDVTLDLQGPPMLDALQFR
jgi:hypothetical protein